MAVTHICGFDMGDTREAQIVNGAPTISSTIKHGGGYSLQCSAAGGSTYVRFNSRPAGGAGDRALYRSVQFYMNINTYPAADTVIAATWLPPLSSSPDWAVSLTSTGGIKVGTSLATSAESSLKIPRGRWVLVEVDVTATPNQLVTAYINGVSYASQAGSAAPANATQGFIGVCTTATSILFFDDVVWHNSALPTAPRKMHNVEMLLPVSDNNRGAWTDGAGGTTNLFEALNNRPPSGLASDTNGIKIKTVSTSGTDSAAFNTANYPTAITGHAPLIMYDGGPTGGQVINTVTYRYAQSFTPTAKTRLSLAQLCMQRSLGSTGSAVVDVYTDSSGPSVLLGTSAAFDLGTLPTASWVLADFSFSTPVPLSASTKYWIVLRPTSLGGTVYWADPFAGGDYANHGYRFSSNSGSSWGNEQSSDLQCNLWFDSYVTAVQPIVNDAQDITTGSPKTGAVGLSATPVIADQTFDFGLPNGGSGSTTAAAAATFPTGWGTHIGAVASNPAFTYISSGVRGTLGHAVVYVKKTNTTNREVNADFLGVYVLSEIAPYTAADIAFPTTVSRIGPFKT
jgi:hypothetical protein